MYYVIYMETVDVKKMYKDIYTARQQFDMLHIPNLQFITVETSGIPGSSPACTQAVHVLSCMAQGIRHVVNTALQRDYQPPPLEGLWFFDPAESIPEDRSLVPWKAMIMQPSWVTREMVDEASNTLNKNGIRIPDSFSFEVYREGLTVQTLYPGPYQDQLYMLSYLCRQWIPQQGLLIGGPLHEIYLNYSHRKPKSWKTILRVPVSKEEEQQ